MLVTKYNDNMIRILNVFTILNRGGAETMVMNYYRSIDRSQIQFDFLVHRSEEGAYEQEIKSLGGRIYRLPALSLRNIPQYIQAVRCFFDEHPEYRHVHGHCSELGYFVYKEASKREIPFIAAHAHNTPNKEDIKTPIRNVLKRLIRPYLTHMVGCSQPASNWLFGKERAVNSYILNNAIDALTYRFNEQIRNSMRASLGLTDEVVLGNVSRFCKQKNHHFLIDVFEAFLKKMPRSKLLLVGTGELKNEIERLVADRGLTDYVLFLGSRTDVPNLLMAMDLFFFPSFFEGLSVAMVEAQAAGLNIVTSTGVTTDVVLVKDAIKFLSLEAPVSAWVKMLISQTVNRNRMWYNEEVARMGFDINQNATQLQNYYLSAFKDEKIS